jgi:diacylglycerol kinase family enzyme/membrane-associated phospholipid phosphatase
MTRVHSSRALVVLNPVSSRFDRPAFAAALGAAFGEGAELPEVYETTADEDRCERVRATLEAAAHRGVELVMAGGGDGTISMVADGLLEAGLGPNVRLAVLPLGTANVLARELGVPIDPGAAIALAVESGSTRTLDAIRVDGKHYLTQVGVGLDAGMIEATSHDDRLARGRWAYWTAFWAQVFGWKSTRYEITIDGMRRRVRAWQVVIANAGTLGLRPFTWGPDIEPDDGRLDVCVFNVRSLRDWIALAFRFVTRRHRPSTNARFFTVRDRVRVATRRPAPVQGDGDLIAATPFEASLAKGALRVVVPEPAPEAGEAGEAEASEVTGAGMADVAAPLPPGISHGDHPVVVAPPPVPSPPAASRLTFVGRLGALDTALYFRINRLHAWAPAERLAHWATRSMDNGELWILLAFTFAILDPARSWRDVAAFIAVLWTTSMLVNFPIKSAFRRSRPFLRHEEARVLGAHRPADWSFPSGHSATAFAGAALLTAWAPIGAPLYFAWALLVGWSRVYLGVHYPGDVVIGGAMGIALALAMRIALTLLGWPI